MLQGLIPLTFEVTFVFWGGGLNFLVQFSLQQFFQYDKVDENCAAGGWIRGMETLFLLQLQLSLDMKRCQDSGQGCSKNWNFSTFHKLLLCLIFIRAHRLILIHYYYCCQSKHSLCKICGLQLSWFLNVQSAGLRFASLSWKPHLKRDFPWCLFRGTAPPPL